MPKMKKEADRHFDMEDGGRSYRIAKTGLSDAMLQRIRGYAEGGYVAPPDEQFVNSEVVGYIRDPEGNIIRPVKASEVQERPIPDSGLQMESPVGSGKFVTLKQGVPVDGVTATTRAPEDTPPIPSGAEATRDNPMRFAPEPDRSGLMQSLVPGAGLAKALTHQVKTGDAQITKERMGLSSAKANLGIVPRGEVPAGPTTPAVAPPAPAQQPTRVGMVSTRDPGLTQSLAGLDAEKQARGSMADAAAAAGAAQAKYMQGFNEQAKLHEMEAQDRRKRAMVQTQDMLAKHQAAMDEMKGISTTVDPGRYWSNKSTGQKILGIFGLALGALGAGRDGINRAAMMMQQAIDRDLEAQKAELGAKMQMGRAAVDAAANSYSQARQIFQDEAAADAAWKAGAWDMAKGKLMELDALNAGPQAKAQTQLLSAMIDQKKGEQQSSAGKYAQDANYKNQQLALEAKKLDMARGGGGVTSEQKNMVATSRDKAMQLTQQADQLIALIKKHGTDESGAPIIGTPGVARDMDLLSHGMAKDMASMTDPKTGVRDAEMESMAKTIFKRGYGQFDADAIAGLEALKRYAAKRYLTDVQATQ